MKPKIRGSDVYVVEDIERILNALAGAARRYAGEYGAGYADALRDVAAGVGATAYDRQLQEVAEYRAERTVERYQAPAAAPERRFAIRGETEEWPAPPRREPVNMTGDDVNVTTFNTATGRLIEREIGFGWIGHDGSTAFWSKSDWQQISAAEAEAWQLLVPEQWSVLVRHAYADRMRRQIADNRRMLQ